MTMLGILLTIREIGLRSVAAGGRGFTGVTLRMSALLV